MKVSVQDVRKDFQRGPPGILTLQSRHTVGEEVSHHIDAKPSCVQAK